MVRRPASCGPPVVLPPGCRPPRRPHRAPVR